MVGQGGAGGTFRDQAGQPAVGVIGTAVGQHAAAVVEAGTDARRVRLARPLPQVVAGEVGGGVRVGNPA